MLLRGGREKGAPDRVSALEVGALAALRMDAVRPSGRSERT